MIFKVGSFGMGFAVGFGTGLVTREIATVSRVVIRPMVKSVVKTSMATFERSREAFAHMGETFEDLVAEARHELETAPAGSSVVEQVVETAMEGGTGAEPARAKGGRRKEG